MASSLWYHSRIPAWMKNNNIHPQQHASCGSFLWRPRITPYRGPKSHLEVSLKISKNKEKNTHHEYHDPYHDPHVPYQDPWNAPWYSRFLCFDGVLLTTAELWFCFSSLFGCRETRVGAVVWCLDFEPRICKDSDLHIYSQENEHDNVKTWKNEDVSHL